MQTVARDCFFCCFGCRITRLYQHRGPYLAHLEHRVLKEAADQLANRELYGNAYDHTKEYQILFGALARAHIAMYVAAFPPQADGGTNAVEVPMVLTTDQMRTLDKYYSEVDESVQHF